MRGATRGRAKERAGLERELDGYWSLRVGRHRIIYRPDSAGTEIAAFGPRRTIYEDMARSMARRRAGKREVR